MYAHTYLYVHIGRNGNQKLYIVYRLKDSLNSLLFFFALCLFRERSLLIYDSNGNNRIQSSSSGSILKWMKHTQKRTKYKTTKLKSFK